MNKTNMIITLVFTALLATSCGDTNEVEGDEETQQEVVANDQEESSAPIAKDVSAEEFNELIASGNGQLLDVRTAGEYAGGHINDAMNIDFWGDDFESRLEELDKNKPVYVYCQSGGRSGKAMKKMKEKGFKEVYNLKGGYGKWPY